MNLTLYHIFILLSPKSCGFWSWFHIRRWAGLQSSGNETVTHISKARIKGGEMQTQECGPGDLRSGTALLGAWLSSLLAETRSALNVDILSPL